MTKTQENLNVQKAVARLATAEYCLKLFEKITTKGLKINNDHLLEDLANCMAAWSMTDNSDFWATELKKFIEESNFSSATEWESGIHELIERLDSRGLNG